MTTSCISSPTALTVNAIPANLAAPTASVTIQPACTTPTGTIVVTAPTGASIQYSNGGAYQASATFSGLTPGGYSITAKDITTGCVSSATALTVNAIPANPATPTSSVTVQPTCTTPTGTIVVTAPAGASIQYSNGGAYQASTTFSGLNPGAYNITAQNTTTGCISSATALTVNAVPTITTPTASVTVQPTCTTPTGTIVVTVPTGASIQYSNGGAYQSSATFSGLTPGAYNITAKNTTTGCISSAIPLTVNALPTIATPTANVTVQPTCTTPSGTIVITAPIGASIQYSNGGAYQASATFSGLNPGSYTITAKNITTGCISSVTVLTVNAVPANPVAPSASVTVQPTCSIPTGTIVVTAPTGVSIQYSNGGAYQASAAFSGLSAGGYSITAQDMTTGCISSATALTVNANPIATASFTASPIAGSPPLTVNFTNNSTNATNYLWTFGDGNTSTSTTPNDIYLSAGSYSVVLMASNGGLCPSFDSLTILVYDDFTITIPNIFTPNGDGKNDDFAITSTGVATMDCEIFDRWGIKMTSWPVINGKWDGRTTSGSIVSVGTYYYSIKVKGLDGKERFFQGYFTLTR
jgi:gliding motility-associated-like protein